MGFVFKRWGVFGTCMEINVANACKVTYAAVILHNLLIRDRPQAYLRKTAKERIRDVQPNVWHEPDILDSLERERGNTGYDAAETVREHLATYLDNVATVPWQDCSIAANVSIF